MAKLLLFLQDGSAREVPLEKEKITIGRRRDCDVPLPYPTVSGHHALFSLIGDQYSVEDLKSTNGTLLNGVLLTERKPLKDRDQVDIGGQKFVFLEGALSTKSAKNALDSEDRAQNTSFREASPREVTSHLSSPGTSPGRTTLPDEDDETNADSETFSGLHFPTIFRIPAKKRPIAAEPATEENEDFPSAVVEDGALLEDSAYNLPEPIAVIEAVSGPNHQRKLLLRQGEYTLGRPGLQLVCVRVNDEGCFLRAIEGEPQVSVRDREATREGLKLEDGDTFTVANSSLQFRTLPENGISAKSNTVTTGDES